jgi:glycosyltransferase involved in cell wall biosynthesis
MAGIASEVDPPSLVRGPENSRERVRVLKFVTTFGIGGTERQVMSLARSLDGARYQLHLACLRRSDEMIQRMMQTVPGAPPAEFCITNLYNSRAFRERLRLAMHLRGRRIDIVHTYNFYPNAFAIPAARVARAPIVVASIRDMGVYLTPRQLWVQRLVCRFAHRVVVNSDAVRQWLVADGYDDAKIDVIRNGVDLSRFARRPAAPRLRHELGLPASTPLVGAISRLSPSKGLEYFLDAAAIVAAEQPDVRFLIVGEANPADRDYPPTLRTYADRLGLGQRVIFTGLRLDIPELLAELAVSVQPSLSEGLSNVVLESMAADVPVVATRVGGNPEAVEDGVTGLLVAPRDAPGLAGAIRRVLRDRRLAERLGRAGRQRVAERFGNDAATHQTERLYERLLEARRPGR